MIQLVRNIYLLIAFVLVNSLAMEVKAQVTIGSSGKPSRAALLDIKDRESPGASNETATTGGLLLPRVMLVDTTTLEPFILKTDPEWINANTSKVKEKHIGLQVYNLNLSNGFTTGIYVWNGSNWETQERPDENFEQNIFYFFYVPSFNIKLEVGTNREIDLYAEYEKQFSRSINNKFVSNPGYTAAVLPKPGTDRLYRRDELYYAITDYDRDIIFPHNLTITDDGKLIFQVTSLETTKQSYINIVFVVKQ